MAYFSNSTDGSVLEQQCEQCPLGADFCPVHSVQLLYNYDQLSPGNEKLREAMDQLVSRDGRCQVRKAIMEAGK